MASTPTGYESAKNKTNELIDKKKHTNFLRNFTLNNIYLNAAPSLVIRPVFGTHFPPAVPNIYKLT
jgi:hypothetical protein